MLFKSYRVNKILRPAAAAPAPAPAAAHEPVQKHKVTPGIPGWLNYCYSLYKNIQLSCIGGEFIWLVWTYNLPVYMILPWLLNRRKLQMLDVDSLELFDNSDEFAHIIITRSCQSWVENIGALSKVFALSRHIHAFFVYKITIVFQEGLYFGKNVWQRI